MTIRIVGYGVGDYTISDLDEQIATEFVKSQARHILFGHAIFGHAIRGIGGYQG